MTDTTVIDLSKMTPAELKIRLGSLHREHQTINKAADAVRLELTDTLNELVRQTGDRNAALQIIYPRWNG